MRKLLFLSVTCLMATGTLAAGPETNATAPATQPAGPEPTKLTLRPSAATQPASRHSLLPDPGDQTPGDAVTLYLLARRFWPDQKTTDEVLSPENGRFDYLDSIDKFPEAYAKRLLEAYAETLTYLDLGARRREAHWDTGWRERGFAGPSPFAYLDDLRHAANLLNFRGRYQILHGDWVAAHYTLQTEFSMAQHVGTEPLLIHALVESGFAQIALARTVEDWIGHGDSPNLYWALTDLPHPFVRLQPIVAGEQMGLRYYKPRPWQALRGELPAQQWPEVVREMIGMLQERNPHYKRDPTQIDVEARKLIESTYSRAKQDLLAGGMPERNVAAMSADEVVGTYLCHQYNAISDELWRVWAFPFPQAQEQMLRAWNALAPDKPPASDNPLIQANLVDFDFGRGRPDYQIPSVLRMRYEVERPDRHTALLRTIEALRDYAARHGGQPPQHLEQMTDLPLPVDPMTGKPFAYRLEGRSATLDAPPPPGRSLYSGWQYELTFAR